MEEQKQLSEQILKQSEPAGGTKTASPSSGIVLIPQCTPADYEKFKSARFVLGEIPTCPPPAELCSWIGVWN